MTDTQQSTAQSQLEAELAEATARVDALRRELEIHKAAETLSPCPYCGTWVCRSCGKRRVYAERFVAQVCGRCGAKSGKMILTVHRIVGTAVRHRELALIKAATEGKPKYPLRRFDYGTK